MLSCLYIVMINREREHWTKVFSSFINLKNLLIMLAAFRGCFASPGPKYSWTFESTFFSPFSYSVLLSSRAFEANLKWGYFLFSICIFSFLKLSPVCFILNLLIFNFVSFSSQALHLHFCSLLLANARSSLHLGSVSYCHHMQLHWLKLHESNEYVHLSFGRKT